MLSKIKTYFKYKSIIKFKIIYFKYKKEFYLFFFMNLNKGFKQLFFNK
jgi:hypothetical protein